MTIAQIMEKMIDFSAGNRHDIAHFVRVWADAKTIGELEGLDPRTQFILETAALTHDIACPLCRKKYGHADGKLQEIEGDPLVRSFLAGAGLDESILNRVAFLVGHHHTLSGIDSPDWQILVEADAIVNASENGLSAEQVLALMDRTMKTASGKRLCREIFAL